MTLRGYDDYGLTLGDEMRGCRATLGASLADVERDLRIRAKTILAIENADLSGFPSPGLVPGYVRAYARHIGMEPERCYRRFCLETGFRSQGALSPAAAVATPDGRRVAFNTRTADTLADSRFALPPTRGSGGAASSLRMAAGALAALALIGGLAYGGLLLLRNVQQVGASPFPGALALPSDQAPPTRAMKGNRPRLSVYEKGGLLFLARTIEATSSDRNPPDADAAWTGEEHAVGSF